MQSVDSSLDKPESNYIALMVFTVIFPRQEKMMSYVTSVSPVSVSLYILTIVLQGVGEVLLGRQTYKGLQHPNGTGRHFILYIFGHRLDSEVRAERSAVIFKTIPFLRTYR